MTPTSSRQLLQQLRAGEVAGISGASGGPGLDRVTRRLVELGALLAADAPVASVRWAAERAAAAGADDEKLVGVLLAAAAAAGAAQTVTSAPRLALAIDVDMEVDRWDDD